MPDPAERIVQAVSANQSNAILSPPDRVFNVAYMLGDGTRPGRVQVNVTLTVAPTLVTAQSAMVSLQVGPDAATMVEQAVESEGAAAGLLVPMRTLRRTLYADLPPGQSYRIVATLGGGGTAVLNFVKERRF